jgi:hypothetical protein
MARFIQTSQADVVVGAASGRGLPHLPELPPGAPHDMDRAVSEPLVRLEDSGTSGK